MIRKRRRNDGLGYREKGNYGFKKDTFHPRRIIPKVIPKVVFEASSPDRISTISTKDSVSSNNSWDKQQHTRIPIAQVFITSLNCPPLLMKMKKLWKKFMVFSRPSRKRLFLLLSISHKIGKIMMRYLWRDNQGCSREKG